MSSKNFTKTLQDAGQEPVTDAELEFYIECAELAGMSLAGWFISEPF